MITRDDVETTLGNRSQFPPYDPGYHNIVYDELKSQQLERLGRPRGGASRLVYFVRCGEDGPVKIGTTTDLPGRLRQIQTGQHERVYWFRLMHGGLEVERWLHREFGEHRLRGEWFNYRPEMKTIRFADPSVVFSRATTMVEFLNAHPQADEIDGAAFVRERQRQRREAFGPAWMVQNVMDHMEVARESDPALASLMPDSFLEFMRTDLNLSARMGVAFCDAQPPTKPGTH